MGEVLKRVEKEVEGWYGDDSSGHDINHPKRVMRLALHMQEKEGGDRYVLAVASLVHDIHRMMQNKTGDYCSAEDSLPKIREILIAGGVDKDKIESILHCVEFHEEYGFSKDGRSVDDVETLILQDADNLDAIGAVGIARGFMYAGDKKIPMWLPDIPIKKRNYDEKKGNVSEIHHFCEKLLELKDDMNTETAKKMAEGRHRVIEEFLKEFNKEWEGKA